MKKIILTCDECGFQEESDGDWMPDGWIHDVRKNKIYHNEKCLLSSMTPEEKKKYKEGIWMA